MPTYRDEAIVLRTHKLGEADRIVTLFSRNHGKVRAVAKGVRRTSSRLGARVEPFMVVDVQLYSGRSLDIIQQVETLASYGADIVTDYGRFTVASAMVETADRLVESELSPSQYLLLLGGLRALARAEHSPQNILDSYLMRTMAISGWALSLSDCAICGREGPNEFFVFAQGGALCTQCAVAGSPRLSVGALAQAEALLQGNWEQIDAADERDSRAASGMVRAYTQWQLERGIRSLSQVGDHS